MDKITRNETVPKHVFERRTKLAVPASELFDWHTRAGAFERLTPPWESVRVVENGGGVANGSRVVLEVKVGPLRKHWVAVHSDVIPGSSFTDIQEQGPFPFWQHEHRMIPVDADSSWLEDHVEYKLPLGFPGNALGERIVRRKLERLFRYRHRVTEDDLRVHFGSRRIDPMTIAISGANGLVGSSLVPLLTGGGHHVKRLVRKPTLESDNEISWDPVGSALDPASFEHVDAVVHLAGENIAAGRWTDARKKRILDSRVNGTRLLSEALAQCSRPPQVLVSASAIGFYGDRGDEEITESSSSGEGFLADVCRRWEQATAVASEKGIRVVNLRIGVVLSPDGGALKKMLTPFKLGGGGVIGTGRQYMSWIGLDDLIYGILHSITTEVLSGPVNAVSPNAVTNRDFTKAPGRVLSRPTIIPMPAFGARLAFGELADELLIGGQRVMPTRFLESGFQFRHAQLEDALRHMLGKQPVRAG